METASCQILHTLRLNNNTKYHGTPKPHLRFLPLFSYTSPRNFNFRNKSSQFKRFMASALPSNDQNSSQELAVLLEVEGVLMDVYRLGNRQAFNVAFRKLGLDCANWTEPIYLDLVRKSAGDEERMLILYFNRIGWPTSLPTSEKGTFMKSVLREKKNALDDLVVSKSLPLRPGVEEFIDDAYNEGVPVIILTSYSKGGDKIASLQKIVAALRAGAEYAGVPIYNCVLISGSQSGVAGAEQISMPCIVLRSSVTSNAEFPSANAVMDGFGGADLTISRLRNKRWS
ncbi:hypothetical protein U1Q18_010099 [Sarracenia purpurea var. burkii]